MCIKNITQYLQILLKTAVINFHVDKDMAERYDKAVCVGKNLDREGANGT